MATRCQYHRVMAKGTVSYFDPYDGYGYIVPEGKKSSDAVTFRYDVIDPSQQMVQAVKPNDLVDFEHDSANPRVATKVAPARAGRTVAKKAAKRTTTRSTPAKKATASKKAATAGAKRVSTAGVKKAAPAKTAARRTR